MYQRAGSVSGSDGGGEGGGRWDEVYRGERPEGPKYSEKEVMSDPVVYPKSTPGGVPKRCETHRFGMVRFQVSDLIPYSHCGKGPGSQDVRGSPADPLTNVDSRGDASHVNHFDLGTDFESHDRSPGRLAGDFLRLVGRCVKEQRLRSTHICALHSGSKSFAAATGRRRRCVSLLYI